MSETLSLNVKTREGAGRHVASQLRTEGEIPAILYGHGVEPVNVQVKKNIFVKVLAAAGESTLVDLAVDEKAPVKVLIHDLQHDPLGSDVTHIDFYQVNMSEKINAEVELVFEGVSPAVKEQGGSLIKNLSHVEIHCLPADLLHNIIVDVSSLVTFDDVIRVKDLSISDKVEVMDDPERTVAIVEAPRTEEEMAALEEDVVESVEDVEVEGAKTDEEGASEEGEGDKKDAGAGEKKSE